MAKQLIFIPLAAPTGAGEAGPSQGQGLLGQKPRPVQTSSLPRDHPSRLGGHLGLRHPTGGPCSPLPSFKRWGAEVLNNHRESSCLPLVRTYGAQGEPCQPLPAGPSAGENGGAGEPGPATHRGSAPHWNRVVWTHAPRQASTSRYLEGHTRARAAACPQKDTEQKPRTWLPRYAPAQQTHLPSGQGGCPELGGDDQPFPWSPLAYIYPPGSCRPGHSAPKLKGHRPPVSTLV